MLSRAIRSWMLARGTAALAVLAFAIGIGAATAMYTVVKSVLLRPLPYADSTRWVTIYSGRTTEPKQFGSRTAFPTWTNSDAGRRASTSSAASRSSTKSLTAPGDPRHVTIVSVAPDLVPALGVAPAIGHWFTDNRSAAITDALWRALGANPNIVGTSMTLDRVVVHHQRGHAAAVRHAHLGPRHRGRRDRCLDCARSVRAAGWIRTQGCSSPTRG